MALQTSGAISLDQIHVEAGGTTGTTCSLNDSDIRNLTEASGKTINNTLGTTVDFDDFYGATNIPTWSTTITNGQVNVTGVGPNYGTINDYRHGYIIQNFGHTADVGSITDDADQYYFDNNPVKAIMWQNVTGDTALAGFKGVTVRVQKANATIANTDAGAFKTMKVTTSTSSVTTLNRSDATFSSASGGTDTSLHSNIWNWGSSYTSTATLGASGTNSTILFSRF